MSAEKLNTLMQRAILAGPNSEAAREAQALLKLDSLNWEYFQILFKKFKRASPELPVKIYDPESPSQTESKTLQLVYPTANAPTEILKALAWVDYKNLILPENKARFEAAAKFCTIRFKKMHAGTGSSITRQTYLAKVAPERKMESAKSVDLMAELPDPLRPELKRHVTLAEIQILRSLTEARAGQFADQILHPIVSTETKAGIEAILNQSCYLEPKQTYAEVIARTPRIRVEGETLQAYLPTLDAAGELSFNRLAPGGHAIFAVESLLVALRGEKQTPDLFDAISNGEDLSSHPDPAMVGWMKEHQIPIALVTTDKTQIDKKGGILGIGIDDAQNYFIKVIETAQAQAAGQLALFENLGLAESSHAMPALTSTNLTLFNFEVLTPKIARLIRDVGEEKFLELIAPDLILNKKEQDETVQGQTVKRAYRQLEGAMGSTLMNLDRYWRKNYGEPLVHIINVDRAKRLDFFAPIKSAFDFYWLITVLGIDPKTFRIAALHSGQVPQVSIADDYYKDVQNVLDAFKGADLRDISSIQIRGKVRVRNLTMRGRISILNATSSLVDLAPLITKQKGYPVLHNVEIEIDPSGKLKPIRPI